MATDKKITGTTAELDLSTFYTTELIEMGTIFKP